MMISVNTRLGAGVRPGAASRFAMVLLLVLPIAPVAASELESTPVFGEPVTVTVQLENATEILAADIRVAFDPARLMAVDVDNNAAAGFRVAHTIHRARMALSLARASSGDQTASAAMVLKFLATEAVRQDPISAVDVVSCTLYGRDRLAKEAEVMATDGVLTIRPKPATSDDEPSDGSDGSDGSGGGGCFSLGLIVILAVAFTASGLLAARRRY